jgi:C4-type Zn-finger protein
MIDTDKYEGHTPAPWVLRGMLGNSYMTEADGLLLRDAPLLLAEVKRLRKLDENARRLQEMIEWLHSNFSGYLHELKELIE